MCRFHILAGNSETDCSGRPISLSRGHVRTEDFSINLDCGYFIEIEVARTPSLDNLECQMWGCYETPAILRTHWILSRAGQVELSGSSDDIDGVSGNLGVMGRKAGYFTSSGGRHRIDIDVLSDTSVLNKNNPRLKVEADGEGYNHLSRLREGLPIIPGMVVVIGVVLLLLSRSQRNAEQSTGLGISTVPGSRRRGADPISAR